MPKIYESRLLLGEGYSFLELSTIPLYLFTTIWLAILLLAINVFSCLFFFFLVCLCLWLFCTGPLGMSYGTLLGHQSQGQWFSTRGNFSNVRNIQQMSQTFLVSMGVGARDAVKHPEMHGPAPCPQQRIMWSKMSVTPRLRNSTLVEEGNS